MRRARTGNPGNAEGQDRSGPAASTTVSTAASIVSWTFTSAWSAARCGVRVDGGRASLAVFVASLGIYPFVGRAFFPQTDAGQFTINMKAPTGTRIEVTNEYVARVEDMIRRVVEPKDLKMVAVEYRRGQRFFRALHHQPGDNTPRPFRWRSRDDHKIGSLDYMDRVRERLAQSSRTCARSSRAARWWTRFSIWACRRPSMCRSITRDLRRHLRHGAGSGARASARLPGVGQIYIPQDMNYPYDAPGCRPRSRRRTGADPERRGRQRHHRAELEHHDRAQLLGRLRDRQRLLS